MKPQIILVNGPPRSGKDTLAKAFVEATQPVGVIGKHQVRGIEEKFSYPLKWAIPAFFDEPYNDDWQQELENNKEKPAATLYGAKYRTSQINLSEDWAKPTFGEQVFGHLLAKRLRRVFDFYASGLTIPVIVISDSGFDPEVEAVEEVYPGQVSIVRLIRAGTSFQSDSRTYIKYKPSNGMSLWLENNGSKEALLKNFKVFVQQVLEKASG